MTDDELDRHLFALFGGLNFTQEQFDTKRLLLRLAVDAARREGAEEMRERCIALMTGGRFCRMADHMQEACDCEEMGAAICALSGATS